LGAFDLKRVVKHSPTEGAKPPVGAIVLLPYEPGKPTNRDEWAYKSWAVLPDGSVQAFKGDNKTTREFGDIRVHVEFRVPYMPEARGQGRGNSGVYLQDRYEIQVLDSFGLRATKNDCAAVYDLVAPRVNASLPPLSWQTFDITFQAPRFDAEGKVVKPAVISVAHNGVPVQDKVEVSVRTDGAKLVPAKLAPLKLQFHGNPVRFRNIWVVELKDGLPGTQPGAEVIRAINGGEFAGGR
jgi:hypothetical protein